MKRSLALSLVIMSLAVMALASGFALTAQAGSPQDDPSPTATSEHGWLGLALAPLTDKLAERLGIAKIAGLAVIQVVPNSPAANAVQQKDVLTAIKGQAVADMKQVRTALEGVKPGDQVKLTISRNGASLDVTITAGTAPTRPSQGMPGRPYFRGQPFPHGMGMPFGDDLQGVPREELFDHLLGSQFSIKDKNGNTVTTYTTYGKVVNVSASSITITPNGSNLPKTYQITANTKTRGDIAGLAADTKVTVITKNDSTEALAVMPMQGGHMQGGTTQGGSPKLSGQQRFGGQSPNSHGGAPGPRQSQEQRGMN